MELLNDLYGWLSGLPPGAVYAVLLAIAYLENVIPPVPGDVAIVVAGMVAAAGAVSLPVVVALAAAGGTAGFMTVYAAGRYFDGVLDDPTRFRWLPRGDIRRAEAYVARYGRVVVAANRFLPGVRAVIAIATGMSGIAPAAAAALACASATVWAGLIAYLGFALVDNRAALARFLAGFENAGLVLSGLLAVAVGSWLFRAWRRRRRGGTGQEKEKTPGP
jgi:membrane protein DedA with SNARE-associated domain